MLISTKGSLGENLDPAENDEGFFLQSEPEFPQRSCSEYREIDFTITAETNLCTCPLPLRKHREKLH